MFSLQLVGYAGTRGESFPSSFIDGNRMFEIKFDAKGRLLAVMFRLFFLTTRPNAQAAQDESCYARPNEKRAQKIHENPIEPPRLAVSGRLWPWLRGRLAGRTWWLPLWFRLARPSGILR